MARIGSFDETILPAGWFDETATAEGWFDEDLLNNTQYSIRLMVEDDTNATAQTAVDAPNFTAVAGETLVAVVASFGANRSTVSLSDIVGTNDTWTRCEAGVAGSSVNYTAFSVEAFYIASAAAGSCTVRASLSGGSGDYPGIAVFAISNLDGTSPFMDMVGQVQATPGTGTDAVTSTNLDTLSAQPAMILAVAIETPATNTPAAGTGFTSIGTGWDYDGGAFVPSLRAQHRRVTVTTADDATFTATANTEHIAVALAFKEAGATGSGTTVTPSTASLTLTTFAPIILLPVTVVPSTATLTITSFAPIVPTVVTPSTVSIILATFAPVVPVVVTPTTVALSTATFAPEVLTGITVIPGETSLVLTTYAPVIPVIVTPSTAASLILTTFIPIIPTIIIAPLTALTILTFMPVVTNGGEFLFRAKGRRGRRRIRAIY